MDKECQSELRPIHSYFGLPSYKVKRPCLKSEMSHLSVVLGFLAILISIPLGHVRMQPHHRLLYLLKNVLVLSMHLTDASLGSLVGQWVCMRPSAYLTN